MGWAAAAAAAPAAIDKVGAGAAGPFQMIQGWMQQRKARKIKADRPTYEIPEEFKQNVGMYQNQYQGNMAGYGLAKSEARDTTSETIGQVNRMGGSASQRLAAIQGAGRTEANAMANLAMQNQQAKRQASQGLASSRSALAEEKKTAFQFNQVEPYMMQLARKRALETAGKMNVQTGARAIGGA